MLFEGRVTNMFVKLDVLNEEAIGIEPGQEHVFQQLVHSFFSEKKIINVKIDEIIESNY